jgi:hypothetical protein
MREQGRDGYGEKKENMFNRRQKQGNGSEELYVVMKALRCKEMPNIGGNAHQELER